MSNKQQLSTHDAPQHLTPELVRMVLENLNYWFTDCQVEIQRPNGHISLVGVGAARAALGRLGGSHLAYIAALAAFFTRTALAMGRNVSPALEMIRGIQDGSLVAKCTPERWEMLAHASPHGREALIAECVRWQDGAEPMLACMGEVAEMALWTTAEHDDSPGLAVVRCTASITDKLARAFGEVAAREFVAFVRTIGTEATPALRAA